MAAGGAAVPSFHVEGLPVIGKLLVVDEGELLLALAARLVERVVALADVVVEFFSK